MVLSVTNVLLQAACYHGFSRIHDFLRENKLKCWTLAIRDGLKTAHWGVIIVKAITLEVIGLITVADTDVNRPLCYKWFYCLQAQHCKSNSSCPSDTRLMIIFPWSSMCTIACKYVTPKFFINSAQNQQSILSQYSLQPSIGRGNILDSWHWNM